MNQEAITLEDCLLNCEVNNQRAIINDGQVIDFEEDLSVQTNTTYIIFRHE